MKKNGSPPSIFETDKERSYFLVTLPIHPMAIRKDNTPQVTPQDNIKKDNEINLIKFEKILHHDGVNEVVNEVVKRRLLQEILYIKTHEKTRKPDIEKFFNISKATAERDISLLKKLELIDFKGAPKIGKYILTQKGKKLLETNNNNKKEEK
ncbi:hypothetical protein J7L48_05720 [bacterium]|nr:hypothetical protein [bacterium]